MTQGRARSVFSRFNSTPRAKNIKLEAFPSAFKNTVELETITNERQKFEKWPCKINEDSNQDLVEANITFPGQKSNKQTKISCFISTLSCIIII